MKIRDGRRNVHDMLACPAHVSGLYATNAIALATEELVAPITRRAATEADLARMEATPPPARRTYPAPVMERLTVEDRRQRSLRGAQATARLMGRPRKFSDDELYAALLANDGSQSRAATALGVSRSGVKRRIRHLRAAGPLPPAVSALLRGPGGWWRWEQAA